VAVFSLWSLVAFLLMLGRVQRFGFFRTVLTYLLNMALGLAIAFLIRGFLYQPFNIPSSSMRPTLVVGDYVFVSKFSYGYSRYSFPFSAELPSGRIFAAEPKPGDVVVFRVPKDAVDYVKRVVGLPGDRIQMKQGELFINDVAVKREQLADVEGQQDACGGSTHVKRWRETLANGASYETFDCLDNSFFDNTDVFTVPPGHFFALGDNRDNSTDSRALSQVGYIPFENLIGRVSVIFFSRTEGDGEPPHVRIERVGHLVH
jgi:signal peptidase I